MLYTGDDRTHARWRPSFPTCRGSDVMVEFPQDLAYWFEPDVESVSQQRGFSKLLSWTGARVDCQFVLRM